MRKQHGFTLVELMIALVVFSFAIAAATMIFIPLVSKFKQQSKISETNTEGLVGLELLKTDLENAGYGLPWCFPNNAITYTEAMAAPANSTFGGVTVNDAAGGNPPRALAAFNNITFNGAVNGNNNLTSVVQNSDYLAIKSAVVNGAYASQKWSYIVAQYEPIPKIWGPPAGTPSPINDPAANDYVIVINPMPSQACSAKCLVTTGTTFGTLNTGYTQYSTSAFPAAFSPPTNLDPNFAYLIYDLAAPAGTLGTDLWGPLTMPFNRADYFVGIPANPPARCAIGTGVLYKAILNQDGTFHANDTTPLLDCVADMQVIFGLDMNGDGIIDTYSDAVGQNVADATPITGQGLGQAATAVQAVLTSQANLSSYRSAVVEIRIYILAHEGQQDPNFNYLATALPGNPVNVGSLWANDNAQLGRQVHLDQLGDPNWTHYRWKLYTIVVKLPHLQ